MFPGRVLPITMTSVYITEPPCVAASKQEFDENKLTLINARAALEGLSRFDWPLPAQAMVG